MIPSGKSLLHQAGMHDIFRFLCAFYLPFLLFFVLVAVYGERKIAAFIQSRFGPMDVGPKGIFQTLADLIKLIQKEDIIPNSADKPIFL